MDRTKRGHRPYHHGNLRDALIEAAEVLLAGEGIQDLSLRAVARRAGVSQAAPYAHFDGRRELLAAVAARGFRRLAQSLRRAEAQAGDAPRVRMLALARAYVRFAVGNPMLFRLMFGAELAMGERPEELRLAGSESYAPIREAVGERLAVVPDRRVAADDGSLGAWSLVHGLATLLVDGRVAWPEGRREQDGLIDGVAGVYADGLLVPGPAP